MVAGREAEMHDPTLMLRVLVLFLYNVAPHIIARSLSLFLSLCLLGVGCRVC